MPAWLNARPAPIGLASNQGSNQLNDNPSVALPCCIQSVIKLKLPFVSKPWHLRLLQLCMGCGMAKTKLSEQARAQGHVQEKELLELEKASPPEFVTRLTAFKEQCAPSTAEGRRHWGKCDFSFLAENHTTGNKDEDLKQSRPLSHTDPGHLFKLFVFTSNY
jgi:hypothetical protein